MSLIKKYDSFIHPLKLFKFLHRTRFVFFMVVGLSGLIFNLFLVWLLTEYIFGISNYFLGYLIGLTFNLIYNFILHTKITFKTKNNHGKRFVVFIINNLMLSLIQAIVIKGLVPIIGIEFYLIVIFFVILVFAIINFLISKLWLFNED